MGSDVMSSDVESSAEIVRSAEFAGCGSGPVVTPVEICKMHVRLAVSSPCESVMTKVSVRKLCALMMKLGGVTGSTAAAVGAGVGRGVGDALLYPLEYRLVL